MQSVPLKHKPQRSGTAHVAQQSASDRQTRAAVLFAAPVCLLAIAIVVSGLGLPRPDAGVLVPPRPTPSQATTSKLPEFADSLTAASDAAQSQNSLPTSSGAQLQATQPRTQPSLETVFSSSAPVSTSSTAAEPTATARPLVQSPEQRERNLVVLPYDRETYDFVSELKAALASESWEDAANLITAPRLEGAHSLAPDTTDKALSVSIAIAIQRLHERYPQLREALGERFAALASLRVAEAIRRGDAGALELLAAQFPGTRAAAQAAEWLGNQALASGNYRHALQQFADASAIDETMGAQLSARMRLAAAFRGSDVGEAPAGEVKLGDMRFSAVEFEALVSESRNRRGDEPQPAMTLDYSRAAPGPAPFEAKPSSAHDSQETTEAELPGDPDKRRARRMFPLEPAALVVDGVLFLCNSTSTAAYDVTTCEQLWKKVDPSQPGQRSEGRGHFKPRPLVVGQRLFLREASTAEGRIVCLDRTTGELRWQTDFADRQSIVGDPALVDGRLTALSVVKINDQQAVLKYHVLDSESGRTLIERDLFALRNDWFERGHCEVTAHDEGLIADLAGVLTSIDSAGNVRWVRETTRAASHSQERRQPAQQPLVHKNRIYIASQGGMTMECFDRHAGDRQWTAAVPEATSIAGIIQESLIVASSDSIYALSALDGTMRWQVDARSMSRTPLVGEGHLLIAKCEAAPPEPATYRLSLTWLDVANGSPMKSVVVGAWNTSQRQIGPLIPHNGELIVVAQDPAGEWRLTRLLDSARAARATSYSSHMVRLPAGLPLRGDHP